MPTTVPAAALATPASLRADSVPMAELIALDPRRRQKFHLVSKEVSSCCMCSAPSASDDGWWFVAYQSHACAGYLVRHLCTGDAPLKRECVPAHQYMNSCGARVTICCVTICRCSAAMCADYGSHCSRRSTNSASQSASTSSSMPSAALMLSDFDSVPCTADDCPKGTCWLRCQVRTAQHDLSQCDQSPVGLQSSHTPAMQAAE